MRSIRCYRRAVWSVVIAPTPTRACSSGGWTRWRSDRCACRSRRSAPGRVDHLLGAPLALFSPLHAVGRIAPRALLLIHSRDDANPTTPLSGALALSHATGQPTYLWSAPRGGHAGALAAQPAGYRRRVLAFLRRYLGRTDAR